MRHWVVVICTLGSGGMKLDVCTCMISFGELNLSSHCTNRLLQKLLDVEFLLPEHSFCLFGLLMSK